MNTLTILLTQTKSAAVIEIILLLLGAVIIGYVTAWLYYKSVYVKQIKNNEAEIDKLRKQISDLEEDKRNFQKLLLEKDNEVIQLKKEIKTLKTLNAESVKETDDLILINKKTEELLSEREETLADIAKRKHLLDYNSFGKASGTEKDNFKMISGIGPFIEERLHALDIYTFKQISKFTKKDIETIDVAIEYFSGRIERDEWVAQAKELVRTEKERIELLERIRAKKTRIYYDRIGLAKKEEADDLTVINGIGGWINEKLNALDIFTYRQISKFNEEDVDIVTDAIEFFPGRIERDEWIYQAQELVRIEISKAELLKRISKMKNRIYYDRLGVAQKQYANNLTLIKGISSWIEERLNLLDIYTYEQISKLTPKDVEIISEILEIADNRIEKENWISQAGELVIYQINKAVKSKSIK
jgi:predicted flap endonuclease-1-like 5' DNA nuclease